MYLSVRVERSRHMSQSRQILLGFAAGGIVMFTLALIFLKALVPILMSVVALIISVIVVTGLIAVFAWTGLKMIRTSDSWKWAVATFVSFLAIFVAITFAINWGVGGAIRSRIGWSQLPKGNLFEGSGPFGWAYLVLVVLLVIVVPWSNLRKVNEQRHSKSRFKRPKLRGSNAGSHQDSQDKEEEMNSLFKLHKP